MFAALGKKLFGSVNDRIIKTLKKHVDEINLLESEISSLTDSQLAAQTNILKDQLASGLSLDDILARAFAVVREAAKRTIGQRHYDVQLLGGIVMHKGMIAEMRTGEGKTLASTLPAYLNSLTGKGVHVITINDYLAERDSKWMGQIYRFLGLSVGCIVHGLTDEERKNAYSCDITFGTNNEFGFDYLRDNMKYSLEQLSQRAFNYAIVDEVDSILIDEARTPLIISGPTEDNSNLYYQINKLIPLLSTADYEKDEKTRTASLTEEGTLAIERLLKKEGLLAEDSNLYDIENVALVHHVNQALKAHILFSRDVDYMIKDNRVMIIDEFTGRMMEGRRYSDGLHQALEAKENVHIQNENQTLASITFQNYFRLYPKLAGMTGTAMTEANEFRDIYKLEVIEIPANLPVMRHDEDDVIYRTNQEKYNAIIAEIVSAHQIQQPVLVGTVSIEKSEYISRLLTKHNIEHKVLNAKYHEQEAYIIAQAGRPGAVTIATNMAGRGTDIMLGGNAQMIIDEVSAENIDETSKQAKIASILQKTSEDKKIALQAGGLFVLGTERHESRRIDNQLRGRSARQGDPGRTKFFLSLEDDLMRIFASERISGLLQKLGLKEDEAIFHPMINKALEKAQQRVEGINYEMRKNLLKFDDVMNDQRKVIYEQRIDIMSADDLAETTQDIYCELNQSLIHDYIPAKSYAENWDHEGLAKEIFHIYRLSLPIQEWIQEDIIEDEILNRLNQAVTTLLDHKAEQYGQDVMRMARKSFMLVSLDQLWKEHLHSLDHLRQGINLRAYGQRDPLNEYKKEAFMMFSNMLSHLKRIFIERLAHMEVNNQHADIEDTLLAKNSPLNRNMQETRLDPAIANNVHNQNISDISAARLAPDSPRLGKVGRNEPCPCGSSKKFKYCHGKLA